MKILLINCFVFIAVFCVAQKKEIATVDYVYLYTGQVFQGKIIEYFPEEEVNLKLENGAIKTFREDKIQKIVFANEYEWKRPSLALDSKPKRVYFIFDMQASLIRISTFEGNKIRHGTVAYRPIIGVNINHHLGIGVGTGFEWHFWQGPNRLVPLFMDIRGLLVKRKIAPYYNLGIGYAFPVLKNQNTFSNQKGGLLFHPAFGLSTPINERLQLHIDFGLRFQKLEWAGFTQDIMNPPPINTITYQRFLLKAGVVF